MFDIEDIRKIPFDLEMASLHLKQYITYKLQTSQRTRVQKQLPYPLLVMENALKFD